MLNFRQKLTLFKLLAQGVEHKVSEDELFLLVSRQGPKDLKEPCAQAAIEVKKNRSFPVAGMAAGLFTQRESKALKTAIDQGRLLAALRTFSTYYELRGNRKTHYKHLWSYGFILLAGILISPLPDFYYGSNSLSTYLFQTILPLCLLIPILWLLDNPRHLIKSRFSQELGIPRLLLKIPSIGPQHINNEMGSFLESAGMLKLCGYSWRQAIENSAEQVINPIIQRSLGVVLVRMQRRDSFVDALKACEYFPEDYIDILNAAEQANQVPGALIRFKANQIMKTQQRIDEEIKTPKRLLLLTSGLLFAYTALRLHQLGVIYSWLNSA